MTLQCSTANQIRWFKFYRNFTLRPSVPSNWKIPPKKKVQLDLNWLIHSKSYHQIPKNSKKKKLLLSVSSKDWRLCFNFSLRVFTVSVAAKWRSFSSVRGILLLQWYLFQGISNQRKSSTSSIWAYTILGMDDVKFRNGVCEKEDCADWFLLPQRDESSKSRVSESTCEGEEGVSTPSEVRRYLWWAKDCYVTNADGPTLCPCRSKLANF